MTFEDPTWCFMVVVEGEYIYRLDEVMALVEGGEALLKLQLTHRPTIWGIGDSLRRIPEAVFVFLPEIYPENIFSNISRNGLSPTMV